MSWMKPTDNAVSDEYIYIIYDRSEFNRVAEFCAELERAGRRCWFANRDAKNPFDIGECVAAMKDAVVVLVFMTENMDSSRDMLREVSMAITVKAQIITYRADEVIHGNEDMKFYLAAHQMFDSKSINRALDAVVGQAAPVMEEIPESELRARSDAPMAAPKAKKKRGLFGIFGGGSGGGGPAPKAPERKKSIANFSVVSPRAITPDSYGIINLVMYTDEQREAVEKVIREAEGAVRETSKGGFEVETDTLITVRLESEHAKIADNIETQKWNGRSLNFDFQFYIEPDFDRSQAAFTCYIECNGIPVTRLNFMVAVKEAAQADAIPASVTRSDYRKAFVSYSRKDEDRMLSRILGIRDIAPEMSFWLDKQSMDAGVIWRDEIMRAIKISDILLLFWSVAASRSEEVAKEWKYAFEQKGLSFIAPVPLDPPEQCPPPAELSDLNFTVRSFSKNEITDQLTFYDSNNRIL